MQYLPDGNLFLGTKSGLDNLSFSPTKFDAIGK